ncbi:galactokinase [Rhodococcus sp. SGAir0479]|uniref:galactokinase n=1 Tax=Rhodococcus sp. SGAir0479 TaxID=2567884 RepID=UPI0010CCB43D|nr:galactokinase [Rhodococcus sp. SGAir0479]QCQ92499.1 galactokinase [Rhodococcus sp. SGAir0479]
MTVRRFEACSDAELAAVAADSFRREFGDEPDGVWAAPGRVNLIGEHVDYAGGLCLPIALPHSTAVAVARRTDGLIRVRSAAGPPWDGRLDDVGPGRPDGWASYPAGVVWALHESGLLAADFGGVDAAFVSTVPIGAGLSSSAALECSLALALAPDADRAAIATACVRAENEVAGAPTGGMDQAAALQSSEGSALLLDSASGAVSHVPFDPRAHGLELLVIDTRTPHRLVDGWYAQRRAAVAAAARRLGVASLRVPADRGRDGTGAVRSLGDDVLRRRASHVISEIARVRLAVTALESADFAEFGRLLSASHRSLARDFEVSCPELDSAVESALIAGALGARMTGGGFGGSAIALLPTDKVDDAIATARRRAAQRRLPDPAFAVVAASAPARRLL